MDQPEQVVEGQEEVAKDGAERQVVNNLSL